MFRKRAVAGAILAIVAGLASILLFLEKHDTSRVGPIQPAMRETLARVVLPRFELRAATLDQAVEYLNQLGEQHGLKRRARFAVWDGESLPKGFHRRVTVKGAPLAAPVMQAENTLTIALTNIPLDEATLYVAELAGCQRGQQGKTIVFIRAPDGTFGPFVTRAYSFHLSPSLSRSARESELRQALEAYGIVSYEGTFAHLTPSGKRVIVRNTQEQIDLLDTAGCVSRSPTIWERLSRLIPF